MFKKLSLIAIITALFCSSSNADLAIISHTDYNNGQLSTQVIKHLFLGKRSAFPNGIKAIPIHHAAGSPDRGAFFSVVLRMAENNHQRYWTRMRSTGRGTSPTEIDNYEDILHNVAKTPGSISYIDASLVNESVKVILIIEDYTNI